MPINKDLVAKKLDFLNNYLHKIENMDFGEEAFVEDAFIFLGEKEIIDVDLAKRMGQAADFRNRAVHGYNNFDYKLLFKDYREDVKDLRNFGAEVVKYLESI